MLKDNAIVIDVAINRIPVEFDHDGQPKRNQDGKIIMKTVGDVDFDGAMGSRDCPLVIPVMRCPWRMLSGRSWS